MNNTDILTKLDTALKSLTTADLGSSRLSPEKAQKFVQVLSDSQTILKDATRLDMNSHTRDIDRVGFGGRILSAAQEGVAPGAEVKPVFKTNKLEAKEVIAVVAVTDSTLEDNLETEGFEDSLLNLIGEQASADLEDLFINGKVGSADALLAITNGWLEKAANEVTATVGLFAADVEKMFEAQLLALPKTHIRNRDALAFYVSFDVENDYRNSLKDRNSALGDIAMTSGGQLTYKGIKVVYAGYMPEGTSMLVPTANLVYGIYRDIRIEKDRNAKARLTDFVLTMRVDCHFIDENAAVVATGYTGA
jgi:HK97 family phage major capsid protein